MRYHISRMGKAWAKFALQYDIEYFVMYGSLLGWYFEDAPLSYDDDLDYTLLPAGMRRCVELNNTLWDDRYLLDINPTWCSKRPDPENIIEGHWVDTHTGLYIDLTSFMPTHYEYHPQGGAPYLNMKEFKENPTHFWYESKGVRTFNEHCLIKGDEIPQPINPDKPNKKPPKVWKLHFTGEKCWRDKSQHIYRESDLFPLRWVLYDGVPVTIPNNPEQILIDRYGERFRDMSYYSPRWCVFYDFASIKEEWVPREEFERIKRVQVPRHKLNVVLMHIYVNKKQNQ
eukprot:UN00764